MTDKPNLRQFRAARNWTQPRMAEELGVHIATLVRLEGRDTVDKRTELALQTLAGLHPVPTTQSSPPG